MMTWAQKMKVKQTPEQKARAEAAIRYAKLKAKMVSNNEPKREMKKNG